MKYRYFVSFVVPPERDYVRSLNEMFQNAIVELTQKVEDSTGLHQLRIAVVGTANTSTHNSINASAAGYRSMGLMPTIISFQLLCEIP